PGDDDALERFAKRLPHSQPRRQPRAHQVTLTTKPEVAETGQRCGGFGYFRPLGTGVSIAGAYDVKVSCVLPRHHQGDHLSQPKREHRLPWLMRRWYAYTWHDAK